MSSPEEVNPRRMKWTLRVLGSMLLVLLLALLLNAVFRFGSEALALVLLAAALVAPGAWKLYRARSQD
jgi:uncharacterized membrane protein YqjE